MRWYERILLFGALVILCLCGAVALTYIWPEGWYYATQYRDAIYWSLLAAAGIVAFASWKDD